MFVKEAETNQKKKTLWVCNPTLAVCQIKSEHGGSVDSRTSATPGGIFCLVSSSSRRWQQMKAEQRQVFEVSEVHLSRDEAAKLRLPGRRSTFFLPLIRAGPFWTAGAQHRLRFFHVMQRAATLSWRRLFYYDYIFIYLFIFTPDSTKHGEKLTKQTSTLTLVTLFSLNLVFQLVCAWHLKNNKRKTGFLMVQPLTSRGSEETHAGLCNCRNVLPSHLRWRFNYGNTVTTSWCIWMSISLCAILKCLSHPELSEQPTVGTRSAQASPCRQTRQLRPEGTFDSLSFSLFQEKQQLNTSINK